MSEEKNAPGLRMIVAVERIADALEKGVAISVEQHAMNVRFHEYVVNRDQEAKQSGERWYGLFQHYAKKLLDEKGKFGELREKADSLLKNAHIQSIVLQSALASMAGLAAFFQDKEK